MQICLFIDFIIMSKDKSEMNVLYLEHSIKTVGNRVMNNMVELGSVKNIDGILVMFKWNIQGVWFGNRWEVLVKIVENIGISSTRWF